MTKTELINGMTDAMDARGHTVTKASMKDALEVFQGIVIENLAKGEAVAIAGFCKFARQDVAAKPERPGRNPQTGQPMTYAAKPASKRVKITALKALKEAVL